MSVNFLPIASGSKGNCTYIASSNTKILVDCGISAKKTTDLLRDNDIDVKEINGIFITHEHSDHINGISVLSRKHNIPVYATSKTWDYMLDNEKLGKFDERLRNDIYKDEFCIIDDIKIMPFEISHDAVDPVGYNIYIDDKKISVCTDLGIVTDSVVKMLDESHVILIESNHDAKMLETGPYPYMLKKRVMGHRGHLSNVACGELILKLKNENLKHVYLGHLSDENNKPLLALDTVSNILKANSFDVNVKLAHNDVFKNMLQL